MPEDNAATKLDEYLNEWSAKKGDGDPAALIARLDALEKDNKTLHDKNDAYEKERQQFAEADAYTRDIKPAVAILKGDSSATDEYAENWLNAMANKDSKLQALWNDRAENREAFEEAVKDLAPKFKEAAEAEAKAILNVDDDPQNDDPAGRSLSQAARIARNANLPTGGDLDDIEWGSLSGHDFAVESQKVFAAMRSGELKPIPG